MGADPRDSFFALLTSVSPEGTGSAKKRNGVGHHFLVSSPESLVTEVCQRKGVVMKLKPLNV
jgi:hypothetical protein